MDFKVLEADYHRNGVGGEPFYVGIVEAEADEGTTERMLVTFFPHFDEEGEPCPAGRGPDGKYANGRVAVVSLDRLEECGVGYGNKWRGDAYYAVADALVTAVRASL